MSHSGKAGMITHFKIGRIQTFTNARATTNFGAKQTQQKATPFVHGRRCPTGKSPHAIIHATRRKRSAKEKLAPPLWLPAC
jgi:hypothetical protein